MDIYMYILGIKIWDIFSGHAVVRSGRKLYVRKMSRLLVKVIV